MKANYKDKIQSTTSEVTLGNLYDMNKQLMANESEITPANLELAKDHLCNWVTNSFVQKYLMLLCHELRDYTLFNLDKTNTWKEIPLQTCYTVVNDIIECMTNRGAILAIEDQQDGAWEIWLRNSEGCFAYYLFPYGEAVLEY